MLAPVLAAHLALAAAPAFETRAPTKLPSADHDQPPDQDDRIWYGWQPFIADATAAAFLGGAVWTNSQRNLQLGTTVLVAGGIAIYLFGAPGLHLARERPNAALVDLGMRVGFPLGGLVGGALLALLSSQSGWIGVGFGVGVASAIFTDALGLSWEPPDTEPQRPTVVFAPVHWAPFASAVRGAPVAGLAGTF